MNVGAFAVVTQVGGYNEKLRTIEDYQGLAMRRPVLAALLAFFLLSLIGIPFTGGFFGKFYVFTAALEAGHVWLAVIGLINSGVACFYYLKLLGSVYARPEVEAAENAGSADATQAVSAPSWVGLILAAAATLLLGIFPGHILHLAENASWTLSTDNPLKIAGASPVAPQESPVSTIR